MRTVSVEVIGEGMDADQREALAARLEAAVAAGGVALPAGAAWRVVAEARRAKQRASGRPGMRVPTYAEWYARLSGAPTTG